MTTLQADFSIGLSGDNVPVAFLAPGGNIILNIDGTNASFAGKDLNLGFLSLGLGGSLSVDGQVRLELIEPDSDGRIAFANFIANPDTYTTVHIEDLDPGDGHLQSALTASVDAGVNVGANDLSTAIITFDLGMDASSPFGSASDATAATIDQLIADLSGFSGPAALDLLNFGNISPTEVMGMLGGLLDTLTALASNEFMQIAIPYTGKTVGEILDYGQSFKEDVLDPLFTSGDFMAADVNADGIISLPFNFGDLGDASPDLKIGNIQELVEHFEEYLNLPGLKSIYDDVTGELTFTLDFFRAFGLGDGTVTTITQGDSGVTGEKQLIQFPAAEILVDHPTDGPFDETVQVLTINNAIAGKYSLTGDATTSDPINFDAPAEGVLSVKEAVLVAYDLTDGEVSVELASATNTARTYIVTFTADPGNLMIADPNVDNSNKLRGSLEAFRLSYRDSLGALQVTDVINVQDGSGPLADATIHANIKVALEALTDIGAGKVASVTGSIGSFSVLFADSLDDIAQLGFAGELDLNFTSGLGDFIDFETEGSFGMAGILDTGLTFGINLNADTLVSILPPVFSIDSADSVLTNGQLSGNALFDVTLYNQPAVGFQTALDGDDSPATNEVQVFKLLNADGGVYKLLLGEDETATIQYSDVAATVQTKLAAIAAGVNVVDSAVILARTAVSGSGSSNEIQTIEILNAASGSFTLSADGGTTNTASIILGEDAATIQGKLEALAGIDSGDVLVVQDTSTSYRIFFQGALVNTDVSQLTATSSLLADSGYVVTFAGASGASDIEQLRADARGLSNSAALGTINVTVPQASTNTNTKFDDLAADTQVAIDQALYTAGLTIGFNPSDAALTGWHTTGVIADSAMYTADTTPFTATVGTLPSDIAFTIELGTGGTFSGQVRVANVEAPGNNLAQALEDSINALLAGESVTVSVGYDTGKLTITPTGDTMALHIKSAVQASAGGNRISLDAPLAKHSFSTLSAAAEVARRLEISVDYNNPALQEMAISSAPTSFDGKITDSIDMTLNVNGTPVVLALAAGVTSSNNNLDQLVVQLQAALDISLNAASGLTAGDVVVKRVTVDPGNPFSPQGNRILFEGKAGVVTNISVFVPDSPTNGAITELGYTAGSGKTNYSKAGSYFIEDARFGGNIGLYENNVSATAALGPLGVTADFESTVDVSSGKFFGADVTLDLVNPLDGTDRVTINALLNAINDGQFLFNAIDQGGTIADPATGFIDGIVDGGLGFKLNIEPDTSVVDLGLPSSLGFIEVSAQSPNWLVSSPQLVNPYSFSELNTVLPFDVTGLSSTGVLSEDMIFVLSQDVDGNTYETPIVLNAALTSDNASLADLVLDVQTAVDAGVARLQQLLKQSGNTTDDVATITVSTDNIGKITLAVGTANDATQINQHRLLADIDFDVVSLDLEAILNSLKDLSFDDIVAIFKLVVNMLEDAEVLGGVFDFTLPVIDRSVGDLVDLSGDFLDFVNDLSQNPTGSLQLLEGRLRSLLGFGPIPSFDEPQILSFGDGGGLIPNKILYFDFGFSSTESTTRPFNLDLADANLGVFSQLVGLSATGNLGVEAGVDFDLKLGLELGGSNSSFFIDTTETGFTAYANAFGDDLDFEAALGPVGVFVENGSALIEGDFSLTLDKSGNLANADDRLTLVAFGDSVLTSELGDFIDFVEADFSGDGEVVLPVLYGLDTNRVPMGNPGELRDFQAGAAEGASNTLIVDPTSHFDASNKLAGNELALYIDLEEIFDGTADLDDGLELRLPHFDFGQLSLPSLFTLLSDPSIIIKGLNTVLKEVQGVLKGEFLGFELPLIGDVLGDIPELDFIDNFRLEFLQPLADKISESNLDLNGLIGLINDVIFNEVGGILDFNLSGNNGNAGQFHQFLDEFGGDSNIFDAQRLQFDFDLEYLYTKVLADIDIDLPIPLLSLSGEMEPTVNVAFGLHLGFGIDLDKGFYFVSGHDEEELSFELSLDLDSDDGSPANIEASLAILQLNLTDGVDLDGSGTIDTDEYTRVFLEASVDIRDFKGGVNEGEGDGLLTLPELISQPLIGNSGTFLFAGAGGATLAAQAELGLGGLDGVAGLSLGTVLPSITTDIIINFGIEYDSDNGLEVFAPEALLANISLDLGDFIGGFAGDLLSTASDILDPLAWLIGPDGLLNFRLPLISDLVGEKVRIRDLIDIFDPDNGPKVNAFLDFVEQLYFLVDLVEDAADAGVLNFGDFFLAENSGTSFFDNLDASFGDKEFSLSGLDAFGGDLRDAPNLNNLALPNMDEADFSAQSSTTKSFTSGVTKSAAIDFPILDPANIFGLLLGQPATLFTLEFPEFGFEFLYRQVIPIIGPLAGTFAGKIGGTFDFGIGYDTLGITQTIATDNPAYLLNGFFLNDVDPETGFDRAEITFFAEVAVGAALSLGVATVGVEGGISATFEFDLNDPDLDTKVRFSEISSNIIANSGNPLAMFDVSGLIEFFLRAYVEVLFFEASFEFARLTLFEFDLGFNRPGVLGSVQGDTLTLNIGPNAAGRIQGDTSDGNETIFVKSIADNSVVVWSSQFNIEEAIAATNPFTGIHKIIVNGGEGIDVIDLSGITSDKISVIAHGGAGDDTIYGSSGIDELFGDDGIDTIYGGAGADVIRGGRDDDFLFGEEGGDTLYGNQGNDELSGHGGAQADDGAVDTYFGGSGDDIFHRSEGFDIFDLSDAGSFDVIDGSSTSSEPTLDLSVQGGAVTVFVKDNRIIAGFGVQNIATETILGATNFGSSDNDFINNYKAAFDHVVLVLDATNVTKIIGSSEADIFHIEDTSSQITLDGGSEADNYYFYADPNAGNSIDVIVDDIGEKLKDENIIHIIGSDAADTITVDGSNADGGNIDFGHSQMIQYVAPSDNPASFTDQMIIKIFGNAGKDTINIESTFITVPVRVDAGDDDDIMRVGNSVDGLNSLDSFLNANANGGFGFGPLVLVGGEGHDTVIIDDSADNGLNADRDGNINAFLEKREGVSDIVEIGIVSGLGMKMTIPDGGTTIEVDGHVEYEQVEVIDVRLGTGGDTLTVGGNLELDSTIGNGGTWEGLAKTDAQVPKTRLAKENQLTEANVTLEQLKTMTRAELEALPGIFGILQNAYTFSGMTMIDGGMGVDDLRVLQTQDVDPTASTIVTTEIKHAGNRALNTQHTVELKLHKALGAFVLEFADRSLDDSDPSGDDAVPGAEQTVVLEYDFSDADPLKHEVFGEKLTLDIENALKSALEELRLVGKDFIDDVIYNSSTRTFTIKFSSQLDLLPELQVFDTRLLVDGDSGKDEISIQSIDMPTYVLGGAGNDTLNVNVQIAEGGPIKGDPPEPLLAQIAQKAVSNGVNDWLTVDGEEGGDDYLVYLFGADINSQINLFDSGVSTDDSAIILGTENADLFLLRAAVADDGLAFIAMIKPAIVPVEAGFDVERVNYRGSLDTLDLFALGGDDSFGIDDARINMNIYGGKGEDFFQVGQLYKSQRTAAAGVPNADVFTTIETTRGYLSNGITAPMNIFGGEGNDEFVVYHNLAPLGLFGGIDDDSFLIRAFALVGSQEDLRERTDVSGGAGADLIRYAVNAPVNIDGGDGFDTVIVIGTEFNDDFVITEDGVFGAGLNIQFVRVETVEVDGDAGDDRFFILGTSAGILTKITGGLGSDTFFANGPTPDVVSNDLLGHSGLITHSVDSLDSNFSGIKVQGISANVGDDDEPFIRVISSDGSSIVSQVTGLADTYQMILTRKPEEGAEIIVTSFAPRGVRFIGPAKTTINGVDYGVSEDGDSVSLLFTDSNWNIAQTVSFIADQQGEAEVTVLKDGGDDNNAVQVLGLGATEGSFTLESTDADLGLWTTDAIMFDIRGLEDPDLGNVLEALRVDIQTKINAKLSGITATVTQLRSNFTITFDDTTSLVISELLVDASQLTGNDLVGTGAGFITHDVSIQKDGTTDTISGKFVRDDVAEQRDGTAIVNILDQNSNAVQYLSFDASDGYFFISIDNFNNPGELLTSEEMLFIPLEPLKVLASIQTALDGLAEISGVSAVVIHNGTDEAFDYKITFDEPAIGELQIDDSNLTMGERTLKVVGGLPKFVFDPDGDNNFLEDHEKDLLRGATVKIIAGAGIGQTRLIIANDADTITVANPWIEALDETSRIEILRYAGLVLPATSVEIVGDDGFAIDLRETGGETLAFEASEVHGFIDDGNGIDDNDSLNLVDTIEVSLAGKPSAGDVTVKLDSDDAFGNRQLFFALKVGVEFHLLETDSNDNNLPFLTFSSNDGDSNAWNKTQTVYVFGTDDSLTEGFHKSNLTLIANGGGYSDVESSIVVDIADNEVALAMILETDGTTDVVETGNFFNTGGEPVPATTDTYQVVLSRAPTDDVTVKLSADLTRTQRGAGLLGIRAFDQEVDLSDALLTFTDELGLTPWYEAQTVSVTAHSDTKVDGGDSKSFPVMFDQANSIEGPLEITGGLSADRNADLEREPVVLPGETNLKPSIGSVQATASGEDSSYSLTIDLNEVILGETKVDTRVQGGDDGIVKISTNTNGDLSESIQEIQVLTIDAVSGSFRLSFKAADDLTLVPADISTAIHYDRFDPMFDPEDVALDIFNALSGIAGGPTILSVEDAGTAYMITFQDFNNHELINVVNNADEFGKTDLQRIGTVVDSTDKEKQALTIAGNGGSFTLSFDGGVTKTGVIEFSPDDPLLVQSAIIEQGIEDYLALNPLLLGVGAKVEVSGSNSSYVLKTILL